MRPLLSVLVPVYNVAAWLPRCLDSICAQSYEHMEILCVDDGSTDESPSILEAYAARDSRIKVIRQQNGGLSAARNTALEHATGEWVAGVDSDDYLDGDIFLRAMSCVTEEVDMVAFGVRRVWDETGVEPEIFEQFPADQVLPMSVQQAAGMHVCFWNKIWRRSVIEEHAIRFPHGLVHEDDGFFYQFVPYARKVALCAAVGYNYMQRQGSIVHSGQSGLETSARYVRVMHFVADVYALRGINLAESPWFQLFVSRVYADRYHVVQPGERMALSGLFHTLLQELKLLPAWEGDYRFRCMMPVRGWRRCFLSRYLNTELWRVFGVPLWEVEYRHGKVVRQRFMLLRFIGWKLGING
ncbi:MAG: glycosyltransferase [Akkermansia sp.]|nr:glycosyltransferase [Akkermansia sp.]